jgi:fructoselysine-6-P-deglycase FrlB-like protein
MRSFLNRDVGAQVSKICSKRRLWNLAKRFVHATEWLFIGWGSSYYVALSAAATMAHLTGLRARALPASEILFYQEYYSCGRRELCTGTDSAFGRSFRPSANLSPSA